jgi:putative tricarboxylic transport membrane protein
VSQEGRFRLPAMVISALSVCLITAHTPLIAHSAQADWKPEKNVTIIVHQGPGGGNDKQARVIQKIIESKKLINTTSIVENKEGGGGVAAWAYLNRHPGDGHFIATVIQSLLSVDITKGTLKYTDFTPLGILNTEYVGFLVKPDSPIKTGKDMLDRLKKDPKSISFGLSSGFGGANHNTMCLVMDKAGGIDIKTLKTVLFNSGGDGMAALLGGHVDLLPATTSNIPGVLEAGKVRVIAISSPQRLGGILGNVPTWKEQGIDVVFSNWRGIIGPKGLSQAQIAYWDTVFAQLVKTEDWRKALANSFQEDIYMNSKEAQEYIANEYASVKSILTRLGLAK